MDSSRELKSLRTGAELVLGLGLWGTSWMGCSMLQSISTSLPRQWVHLQMIDPIWNMDVAIVISRVVMQLDHGYDVRKYVYVPCGLDKVYLKLLGIACSC